VLLWLRLGQVATHGRTQPHGDGVGPWVVEGRLGSAAIVGERSGGTPEAAIVPAPATTSTTTRGGRGTRAPEERDRRCNKRQRARLLSTGGDEDVTNLRVVHMSSMAP
jgi:hypothetical protein